MRNKKRIIAYSILTLLFSVVFVYCYMIGNAIDELNSRINGLTSSIEIYKSNEKDIKDQLTVYRLENDNLKALIYERDSEIKELTKENEKLDIRVEKSNTNDSDLRIMAQLIESESGNQPFEGKLAVGTVVMNRIESDKFPDTIRDVVFQKGQFSVVNNGKIHNKPSDESLRAAEEIMNGTRVLNVNVLYFYNPKLVSMGNWIRKQKVTNVIKDHAFAV